MNLYRSLVRGSQLSSRIVEAQRRECKRLSARLRPCCLNRICYKRRGYGTFGLPDHRPAPR
jgi:hypothetical protein